MLHKTLFLSCIALVAVLATASKAQAWVGPVWGVNRFGVGGFGPVWGVNRFGVGGFGPAWGVNRFGVGGFGPVWGGIPYGGFGVGGFGLGGFGGFRTGYFPAW
jgi:hypothetical protein